VVKGRGFTLVAIGVAVAGTVLLGVLPSPVLQLFGDAARFLP